MLKIRLARVGRKNLPFYHIVVSQNTSPRDSNFLEKLGTYDPLVEDEKQKVVIKKERAEYWISVGAQPTEKVSKFLITQGVKDADKYKPSFKLKNKGDNLKKKALEKLKREQEEKEKQSSEQEVSA